MKRYLDLVIKHTRTITSSMPILVLFLCAAGLSIWESSYVPAPLTHTILTRDYEAQAELWKRRVLSHLEDGVSAFHSRSLSEEEMVFLAVIPEASDVYRFKLFDAEGYVFWSTRMSDLRTQNTKDYFSNIVAKGDIFTKQELKPAHEVDDLQSHALDAGIGKKHIIYEVYVPIADNGVFVGAIEFYTDATTLFELTETRIRLALATVSALMTLMITATAWILLKTSRHQVRVANRKTAEEREFVEKQMQLAREVQLLGDLNEWLQSSQSLSELFDMVARFMSHLLPDAEGSIYVYSNSRDVLDGCAAWNDGTYKPHIHPSGCWGLRRGRTYEYGRHEVNFCCEHAEPHDGRPYYCFPILAHGETVGLMHLRRRQNSTDREFFKCKKLAQMCAEQISMAIANVRMRDQLEEQSTRDPLTGLFNRRYMLDRLRRLVNTANTKKEQVHLVYVDVDHFKKFNDTHGHDAGDIVLREVANALLDACDGDDVACRMGGEEFMLILPGSNDKDIKTRADKLRQKVEALRVLYQEKHLPTVTISSGIARYPDDDKDIPALLRHADKALYAAKDNGRNRVMDFADLSKAPVAIPKKKSPPPTSVAAE